MKKSTRTSLVSILKTVQVLEKRIQKLLDSESPKQAVDDSSNKTYALWNKYSECYYSRWRVEPSRSAKAMSILNSLIAQHGYETAEMMVEHYLVMYDAFYNQAAHPLTLLRRDADRILVSAKTGKSITKHEAIRADKGVAQQSLLDKIKKGEV